MTDQDLELKPMLEMEKKDWVLFYRYFRDRELAGLNGAKPIFMPLWLFKNIVIGEEKSGERIGLAIYKSGVFIGSIEFYDIISDKKAMVGVLIGEKMLWGLGLGTRALRLALEYIFMQRNFERITLETLQDNHRARASFEKVGFQFLRVSSVGKLHLAHYELEKKHWVVKTKA